MKNLLHRWKTKKRGLWQMLFAGSLAGFFISYAITTGDFISWFAALVPTTASVAIFINELQLSKR